MGGSFDNVDFRPRDTSEILKHQDSVATQEEESKGVNNEIEKIA